MRMLKPDPACLFQRTDEGALVAVETRQQRAKEQKSNLDTRIGPKRQRKLVRQLERLAATDAAVQNSSSNFSVYVIEVAPVVVTPRPIELYVGSTAKSPEARFDQHLSGDPRRSARMFRGRYLPLRLRTDWMEAFPQFSNRESAELAEGLVVEYLMLMGYAVHSDKQQKRAASVESVAATTVTTTALDQTSAVEEVVPLGLAQFNVTYFLDAADVAHIQNRSKVPFLGVCGLPGIDVWWHDEWQPGNYPTCRRCDDLHPYVLFADEVHVRSAISWNITVCGRPMGGVHWQADAPRTDRRQCGECRAGARRSSKVDAVALAREAEKKRRPFRDPKIRVVSGGAPGLGGR